MVVLYFLKSASSWSTAAGRSRRLAQALRRRRLVILVSSCLPPLGAYRLCKSLHASNPCSLAVSTSSSASSVHTKERKSQSLGFASADFSQAIAAKAFESIGSVRFSTH